MRSTPSPFEPRPGPSAARSFGRAGYPCRWRPVLITRPAAIVALVLVLSLAILACTDAPSPASTPAAGARLTGTLLEKLDGPPYSYLRLRTATGEVWAAVPVTAVDPDKPVTVLDPVSIKDYTSPQLGRRLDVVYFGTLEVPRP
jgi:hypothetical protein